MRWQLQNVWGGKWAFFWKGALVYLKLATSCENHSGITQQRNDFEQTSGSCRCCTDCGHWREDDLSMCHLWPIMLFWSTHAVKIMSNSALNLHVYGKLKWQEAVPEAVWKRHCNPEAGALRCDTRELRPMSSWGVNLGCYLPRPIFPSLPFLRT